MPTYPVFSDCDTFIPALQMVHKLVERLSNESTKMLEHAELEVLIDEQGTEVLRQLLQGHFDLRAAEEEAKPVVGADNIKRRHKRHTSCGLLSLFGLVTVNRIAADTKAMVDSACHTSRGGARCWHCFL